MITIVKTVKSRDKTYDICRASNGVVYCTCPSGHRLGTGRSTPKDCKHVANWKRHNS